MAKIITFIPATPRSKSFHYYHNAAELSSSGGGSSSIINTPSQPDGAGYNAVNIIGSGNVVGSIAENATDDRVIDVTMTNAVKRILAGSNITVSPTGGTGDVTINAQGGSGGGGINFTGGTGDIVRYLSYNPSTNTLTETRANLYDLAVMLATPDTIPYPNNQVPMMTTFFSNYGNPGITANFLYKMLKAGTGISFTQSGSDLVISATGGGGGPATEKVYGGFLNTTQTSIPANGSILVASFSRSAFDASCGMNVSNVVATPCITNGSTTVDAIGAYIVMNTSVIQFYLTNASSSPITFASNRSISYLAFGY